MDQVSKEKTLENLTRSENIQIAVSENSGLDGLAAGLALYLSCLKLGKNISISAKSPTVSDATMIYGVDKIGQGAGKTNLVIVVKDAIENVDKVTYFLEGDKLKIVIHPFPGSIGVSQEQITYEQASQKPNLIFAIGFETREDLIRIITHEQNLDSNVWIISINREQLDQKFAQTNVFIPGSASLSEVTAQFIQDLALPVDEDIAYNLFTGISSSTKNFSPSMASQTSFQIASWLIKFGAGRASLADESRRTSLAQPSVTRPAPQPTTVLDQPVRDNLIPNSTLPTQDKMSPMSPFDMTPIEDVERQKTSEKDWLKPPKIYKGSKAFDREN